MPGNDEPHAETSQRRGPPAWPSAERRRSMPRCTMSLTSPTSSRTSTPSSRPSSSTAMSPAATASSCAAPGRAWCSHRTGSRWTGPRPDAPRDSRGTGVVGPEGHRVLPHPRHAAGPGCLVGGWPWMPR